MLVDALLVCPYRLAGQASKLVDSDACPRPYDRSSRPRSTSWSGPARRGGYAPSAFPTIDRFCMALLYARAGRLPAQNGGCRPGQMHSRQLMRKATTSDAKLREATMQNFVVAREGYDSGSVAPSRCSTAYPLHTGYTNMFGTSSYETTMRPNPRYDVVVVKRKAREADAERIKIQLQTELMQHEQYAMLLLASV